MKKNKEGIPAVVFGLFETGLGVIRSLGQVGIPVIGLDSKKDIGWYSRYCTPKLCPDPKDEEVLTSWLMDNFIKTETKSPVFITNDTFLSYVNRNRDVLSKIFLIDIPDKILIDALSDKYEQFKLAKSLCVSVPHTWKIMSDEDFKIIEDSELYFPLFVKGLDVNSWRRHFGGTKKGFVIYDKDQYKRLLKNVDFTSTPLLMQELIEGPDTNHYKYCAYYSNGKPIAEFMLQKIRQYPIHFGIGSAVKSVYDDKLLQTGRKLFSGIGYNGVGSAEFKWNNKTNTFFLIELNPRYWQQNYLATFCNLNFPKIQYDYTLGLSNNFFQSYDLNKLWINRYMDFSAFLDYRNESNLGFWEWRKSLKGRKVYPDFSWDDPLPFFYESDFGRKLLRAPMFLIKRLSNK